MMEYERAKAFNAALASERTQPDVQSDRPYFARLGDLAEEASRIGDYIEQFIDRCRGGARAELICGNAPSVPKATGHFADLSRLTDNLARVDKLARELQTLG